LGRGSDTAVAVVDLAADGEAALAVLGEPLVLQGLLQRHPFARVANEQPIYEVPNTRRQVVGVFELALHDLLVGLVLATLVLEWCLACSHFIAEYADAPDIDPVVVGLAYDDLRRNVI